MLLRSQPLPFSSVRALCRMQVSSPPSRIHPPDRSRCDRRQVKPAVISVRVKIDAGPLTLNDGISPFSDESPLERFLRRFGLPDDAPGGSQAPGGRNIVTGQRSGFFISADGYAVTNGHVVDKAKTLDITTDSGKSCTAKVIGIDSRSDIVLIKVEGVRVGGVTGRSPDRAAMGLAASSVPRRLYEIRRSEIRPGTPP